MKKAAFLFFRVEVGNAACAVQYLVVVQTMLVRCPKNLDFTVFQKVSLSNLIFVRARLTDQLLELWVSDEGTGIANVQKAMEPLYTTRPELERSGMGFMFMEAFMDQIHVESAPGVGTTVYMKKQIGHQDT